MVKRVKSADSKARGIYGGAGVPGRSMPPVRPTREMGTGGTAVFGGFVQVKDKSSKWYGQERYNLTSEILSNVSIVAASVRHFLNLISNPSWKVVPASDSDPEAIRLAETVEAIVHDMQAPFRNVVRRTASYQFHGFCVQEWTAKRGADGVIGIDSIESRPQHTIERWEIGETGSVLGVWQRSPQTGQLLGIPRSKIIYSVDDTFTDSPEGLGIFRQLLDPFIRLKQMLKLETYAFERDLRGIPIGRAPLAKLQEDVTNGVISQDEANNIKEGLQNFIEMQVKSNNTALLLDSQPYESEAADGYKISNMLQWGIDLLQGTSNGLGDLAKAIDRIQREMARVIGTEHLMMGDQGGNRALGQDKSRNLYLVANSVLRNITDTYDHDVIDTLWKLNNFPMDKKPWFASEDVSFRDVEEISNTLRNMATAGAVISPDDPAIDDVRDLLGVSRSQVDPDVTVLPLEEDDEDSIAEDLDAE